MTNTTGIEWKRFYADKKAWPKDAYHEDELITVNGKLVDEFSFDPTKVQDSDRITLEGGMWFPDADSEDTDSLEGHFKKWRKSQSTEVICVEVQKDKACEIRKLITKSGGKVL